LKEVEVNILRPFGPRILHGKIPQEFIDELNNECDSIIADEQKRKELDESQELVGHVSEELKCDMTNPKFKRFGIYLCEMTKCLHNEYLKEKNVELDNPDQLAIHNSWFVRSFEYDYNPTHIHTGSSISCVIYLKVPENISTVNSRNTKEKYATEGYIDFIYGSSSALTAGNLCCLPAVGDIYIFPSHLFHTVYPFYGKGERRSFSANMDLIKKQKTEG
jgi:uncharacterized protein (TIGR02466 family)